MKTSSKARPVPSVRQAHEEARSRLCPLATYFLVALLALPLAFLLAFPTTRVGAQEVVSESEARRQSSDSEPYEFTAPSDHTGTGKWFKGREIAHYMSHHGAAWLDRPERQQEERPDLLVEALELRPGMLVGDFGAGSGYLSVRMAPEVLPGGRILAADIQPEMLEKVRLAAEREALSNVETILSTVAEPMFPTRLLDLIVLVDVYHEVSDPAEILEALAQALKVGGRLVLVEYRQEDASVPIKRLHKMSEDQIRLEVEGPWLGFVKTDNRLPRQHIVVFERLASPQDDTPSDSTP